MFSIDNFTHYGTGVTFNVSKGDTTEHFMFDMLGDGVAVITDNDIFKDLLSKDEYKLLSDFIQSCMDICSLNLSKLFIA